MAVRSFKVMYFGITIKATMIYIILYDNVGLAYEASDEI